MKKLISIWIFQSVRPEPVEGSIERINNVKSLIKNIFCFKFNFPFVQPFDKLRANGGDKFTKINFIISLLICFTCILPHNTFAINIASLIEQAQEQQKNEHFDEAIKLYNEILAHTPSNINVLFNLGNCHLAIGHPQEAIDAFEQVLRIEPKATAAEYNAAYTRKAFGQFPEAIAACKKIIAEHPEYEPAHLMLGFTYLMYGDFENGWKYHERYLKQSGKNGDALRALLANNDIAGKTVLLKPEGDLGDTLLFIRYAQRLHEKGARVIAVVQKSLLPLLSRCPYMDHLLPNDITRIPQYHADATIMSLPAIFNDNENTVPRTIPYLFPDPELVTSWKEKLAADKNFKIGICWQVCKKNDLSRLPIAHRACPLEKFFTLKDLKGISFYSLQKYDGVEELAHVPQDFPLHIFDNLDEQTGAFMDTAAIMKNLDLIITVDTAIVHLAGALGCPVWLCHPVSVDWRWIYGRTDSYWYPTLRIFRQQKPFDWDGVMQRVKDALQNLNLIK